MFDYPAFPAIFFLLSGFAFGVAVLYALARAWEKALAPRQALHTKENVGDPENIPKASNAIAIRRFKN